MRDNDEFWKKHEHILSPVSTYIGCDEAEIEKEALQQSYKQHLASFGLLKEVIELKQKNIGTTINVKRYEITSLGRLLLKRIGIVSE